MSLTYYFDLIKKNILIFAIIFISYFFLAFYYIQNYTKTVNGDFYYSEILLPKNAFSYDFLNQLENFIIELNTLNRVNMLTLSAGDAGLDDFDAKIFNSLEDEILLDLLLIELSDSDKLNKKLKDMSTVLSVEQIEELSESFVLSPQTSNDRLNKLQLSIRSEDQDNYLYLNEILKYSMVEFNEKIREILIKKIEFSTDMTKYLSYYKENMYNIKKVEFFEKQVILNEIEIKGTAYQEILLRKLIDEVDIKVLDRKKEILINNNILINKINDYFDSQPNVLRSDILSISNFQLRPYTNNFVYVIAFIASIFTIIITALIRIRLKK